MRPFLVPVISALAFFVACSSDRIAADASTSGGAPQRAGGAGRATSQRPSPEPVGGPPFFLAQERVRYASGSFDNGYVIPNEGYELLVAFVQKVSADAKVSADSLRWKVKSSDGKERTSIGFASSSGSDGSVGMFGALIDGQLSGFVGGMDPLLAVVFVIPRTDSRLVLLDPTGKVYPVPQVRNWKPLPTNAVRGFQVGGSLSGPIEGENWRSGFK